MFTCKCEFHDRCTLQILLFCCSDFTKMFCCSDFKVILDFIYFSVPEPQQYSSNWRFGYPKCIFYQDSNAIKCLKHPFLIISVSPSLLESKDYWWTKSEIQSNLYQDSNAIKYIKHPFSNHSSHAYPPSPLENKEHWSTNTAVAKLQLLFFRKLSRQTVWLFYFFNCT